MPRAARLARPLPAALAVVAIVVGGAAPVHAVTPDLTFGLRWEQGPFLGVEDAGLGEAYVLIEGAGEMSRLSLRVPYARIDRTGLVTMASDAPILLGAGGPGKPPWQETDAESSASDLGDLMLRLENYIVRSGGGNRPALSFILDYKYGLADEKKGLGTGESDWGGGLEYVQPLGKVLQFLVTGLYHFMGSPEGVEFEDRLHLMGGFSIVGRRTVWRIVGEHVTPALEEVPVFDTVGVPTGALFEVEDYRVVRGDFVYRSQAGGSTRLYVLGGLNDSSPDIGFGLSFSSRGQ
ncbi:MAG TPA: hypothetical protein VFD06_12415 [Candidatus Polarisedimenticolia bacterium]|nr:hypothetical protein [Candidatus Polarisedimenticolia bacterium]